MVPFEDGWQPATERGSLPERDSAAVEDAAAEGRWDCSDRPVVAGPSLQLAANLVLDGARHLAGPACHNENVAPGPVVVLVGLVAVPAVGDSGGFSEPGCPA